MNSSRRFVLFTVLAVALAAGLMLWSGKVGISSHPGDVLHALDGSYRMAAGEMSQTGFMTPIGFLGFAPIALFLWLGVGPGTALVAANILVALILLPAVLWVALTRLTGATRYVFALVVLLFALAVIYGGQVNSVSYAMHYNRWAWAISYIVLFAALWTPLSQPRSVWSEALVIGLGLSALALLKITFFMAFATALLPIFLLNRRFGLIWRVALIGLLVSVVVSVAFGFDYWLFYGDNLLAVAFRSGRHAPDRAFLETLTDPDRFVGTVVYIGAILLLRGAGRKQEGLILFLLAPAFAYIVYQNWGNDQKWLPFLGLYVLANLPRHGVKFYGGIDARNITSALALATGILFVPIVMVAGLSIANVARVDPRAAEQFPMKGLHRDLWLLQTPEQKTRRVVQADPADEVTLNTNRRAFQGTVLPDCSFGSGYIRNTALALDLVNASPGAKGARVMLADAVNPLWMFSDIERIPGAAPWYYGGDYGFANADYYLLPLCPYAPVIREFSMVAMEKTGWALTETARNRGFILYKIDR